MRLILHIGTEKTATTTLQQFLYQNRAVLAGRGIALSDVCGSPNNRRLAAACQPETQEDPFFQAMGLRTIRQRAAFSAAFADQFRAEVAALKGSAEAMILSSEHCHSRLTDLASVQKLHALLAPLFTEIRILCYFREQAAMAKSLYSTAIKAGKTQEFAEFLDRCTPDNHRFNYHRSFSLWAEVFGRAALTARLFARDRFVGGDICSDFLDAVGGLDPAEFGPVAANQNESLGAHGLMLGRINNRINPRFDAEGRPNPIRRAVAQALEDSALARTGTLAFETAGVVHARFEESNRAFARRFLGRPDNPFPPPRPVSGGADTAIAADDLADFWEEILTALRDLPVPAPGLGKTLRGLARRIEAGETLGRADARALREVARQLRPAGGGASPTTEPDDGAARSRA